MLSKDAVGGAPAQPAWYRPPCAFHLCPRPAFLEAADTSLVNEATLPQQAPHIIHCCGCQKVHGESRPGFQGGTFPNSLVTVPGSGLGLMAMLAAYVGTLLLLGMTLTVGETLMKMGDACTFVGDALSPAACTELLTDVLCITAGHAMRLLR